VGDRRTPPLLARYRHRAVAVAVAGTAVLVGAGLVATPGTAAHRVLTQRWEFYAGDPERPAYVEYVRVGDAWTEWLPPRSTGSVLGFERRSITHLTDVIRLASALPRASWLACEPLPACAGDAPPVPVRTPLGRYGPCGDVVLVRVRIEGGNRPRRVPVDGVRLERPCG
jgi:hypothetical protein